MAAIRKALAATIIGSAVLAAPASAGEYRGPDRLEVYLDADRSPYDRLGTRIHRTALEDGYFGQGAVHNGRGGYDYDRGYPYDYYRGSPVGQAEQSEAYQPREVECRTQWVPDEGTGEKVPVSVCRG
jgi:hypothetical protein